MRGGVGEVGAEGLPPVRSMGSGILGEPGVFWYCKDILEHMLT